MTFQQPHFNMTVLNPADLILKDEDGRVNTKKVFIKQVSILIGWGSFFIHNTYLITTLQSFRYRIVIKIN